jgi:ribose-phosphate pyrophosphokinase
MPITLTNPCIKVNTFNFSAGEVHIQLEQLPKQQPKSIYLRAEIFNSDDLIALLLTHNALINHYQKPLNLHLEIPYFPYARQDRVCAVSQAFSLEVIAKLINDLTPTSLTVWDAHSPITQALTQAMYIPQHDIIMQSLPLLAYIQQQNAVLVCPDKGARDKCLEVKNKFSIKHMIEAKKTRDANTGMITDTQLVCDDLSGKTAIIIDDICDGGRTFIEIAKRLKQKRVERVILYVTHGIFSKGLDVFNGLIDEIFTTNSLTQTQDKRVHVIKYDSNKKMSTKRKKKGVTNNEL